MTITENDPLEPTTAAQLRNSRWLVPRFGTPGVKKMAAAHLFPEGQAFSLCGTRAVQRDSILLPNPYATKHPICGYCHRIAKPKIGPRAEDERGMRPGVEQAWRRREKLSYVEPLLTVAQFEQMVAQHVNLGFQITRNKIVGNTLYVFVDKGLIPTEHLEWITRKARSRDEVEWVEIIRCPHANEQQVKQLAAVA